MISKRRDADSAHASDADSARMGVAALRRKAYPLLARAPFPAPALEFRVLLAHALSTTTTAVAAMRADQRLPSRAVRWLLRAARRRRRGVPIAYLVGHQEFYGLRFAVNRSTLVPRPESELLVDCAVELALKHDWRRVHDCGTGSGNVAIAIRHTVPRLSVSASDVSLAALRVARHNCRALVGEQGVTFQHGRSLRPLAGPVDGIVANPPYLRRNDLREPSIRYEPRVALYGGGKQGAGVLSQIILHAADLLTPRGALLLECAPDQIPLLRSQLIRHRLPRITVHDDLAGRQRVVVARKQ